LNNARFLFRINILAHAHKFYQQHLDSPLPSEWYKSDMNWQEETPKCVLIPENLPRHPKLWVQEHNIRCPVKLISIKHPLFTSHKKSIVLSVLCTISILQIQFWDIL
jgi:hypothetical protein